MYRFNCILLLALVALFTTKSTARSTDCDVQWFRVVVPGKMVYAWNCICTEDTENGKEKIPFVYGGSRYTALDASETTLSQVTTSYRCFRYFFYKKRLLSMCKTNPGGFMKVSTPLLTKCTKYAQKKHPGKGPFPYTRKYCKAIFSQARQVGMDMIAAIWICQCDQPQWRIGKAPMPYIIDGRSPFAIPNSDSRPDVVDRFQWCSDGFKDVLQDICGPDSPDSTKFAYIVHKVWAYCCAVMNVAHDAGLDCDSIIASSRQVSPIVPAYPRYFV